MADKVARISLWRAHAFPDVVPPEHKSFLNPH
jgi:hypothetical protein